MIIPRFTLFQPKNAFICLCQRSLFCCRRHAYVSRATEMMVFGCNTKIRTGYIVAFLSSSHSPFFRFHMFIKECRFHVYLVENRKKELEFKIAVTYICCADGRMAIEGRKNYLSSGRNRTSITGYRHSRPRSTS